MSDFKNPKRRQSRHGGFPPAQPLVLPTMDEVLSKWAQGIFYIPPNIDILATTDEFKEFAVDYIQQFSMRTNGPQAIDMTKQMIERLSAGAMMRGPLLDLILDLAVNIKKLKGTYIQTANEAIFEVYKCAPADSTIRMRAEALIPTGGEYAERLAAIKLTESLNKQFFRQDCLPAPGNPQI